MGRAGTFRVWRATLHLLPASFVAARSNLERNRSLDPCCERLYLAGTHGGGRFDVSIGTALDGAASRALRGGILCGKSVPSRNCVLAQRVRGTAGSLPAAIAAPVYLESR